MPSILDMYGPEAVRRLELEEMISSEQKSEPSRRILALIDLLIDDVRKDNDRASVRGFLRNQGRLAAFEMLKETITKNTDYAVGKEIKWLDKRL